MNNLSEAPCISDMQLEWDRIELLAHCLLVSRKGNQPDEKCLQQLRRLQLQVETMRSAENSPWQNLGLDDLSPLEKDVLVSIYAAEAQPRAGMLFHDLQNNVSPFPSLALIQVLLALDGSETQVLYQLAGPNGSLKKRKLICLEGDTAFSPIRAERSSLARVLDWPSIDIAPPGSFLVEQKATWNDLVLPEEKMIMLHEYMMWLWHKDKVVKEWGGWKTGGPVALFSGPSGTGKTFAASVIAGELGWPLYRVDLGRLVSKYIGETEKNIGRMFEAAHGKEMVLQFDEVDALMSKRGEIKEARDRYANMEVSYLLSRIEDHDGPCILTTNLRNQIDKAFSRRFQIVVEFPRPDILGRALLWQRMLPPRAPLASEVDMAFLAGAVNLTGGNIRNAALHAAYLAADESEKKGKDVAINLRHISTGVWRELSKDKTQTPKSDLGPLAVYLEPSAQDKEPTTFNRESRL